MGYAITELGASVDVLIRFLMEGDADQAFEAISIILLQTLHSFGRDSVATHQFLPVYDRIKARIDTMDLEGALRQARLFRQQLLEVHALLADDQRPN
jgi:hypothetical protein